MGRWPWSNRNTVEECLSLDTAWLNRNGYFSGYRSGSIQWKDSAGDVSSSIGIVVSVDAESNLDSYVQFNYTVSNNFNGEKKNKDYKIHLDATRCNFGGVRYWFVCPLSVEDQYCGKRVGKIYLPPGGDYFGCRYCYDLTYRCQKEHDSRLDRLLNNPAEFLAQLESKKNCTLAVKAAAKFLNWD